MLAAAIASVSVAVFVSQAPPAEEWTYHVDSAQSRLAVDVGRAGLFKVFGHDHRIEARTFSGTVTWNEKSPEASHFILEIDAGSLVVADDSLSEDDRAKVQSDMETKALAVGDHASIRFESQSVTARRQGDGTYRLELEGVLSLRGVEEALTVPLTVALGEETLTATGELELDSERWSVPQISAVGGSVKTKSELGIAFEIRARR